MNTRWLALALLLAACGSSSSSPADAGAPPDGGGVDAPAVPDLPVAADAPTAPDAPVDLVLAAPVKFVLRNETGKTIYIQQGAFWRLLREGMPLQAEHNCGLCSCEDTHCVVCGKGLDVAVAADPGSMQSWDWDGRTWRTMHAGPLMPDYECPAPVPAGPLTVQVVYSLTKEDRPPESYIGPPVLVEQTFQFPPAADVVLIAR